MNRIEILEAIDAADALLRKYKYNKYLTFFTDTGVNARSNYPKQMELMKAGKKHRIRALVGGNGSGKSYYNAFESYLHLSGRYPKWWEGHRFEGPIDAWLCAREAKNLREGLQEILFGGIGDDDFGTGMVPREDMQDEKGQFQKWAMAGTANCIGMFRCKHFDKNGIQDGWSKCEFKTYAQGWAEFQGPTRQWIGFDEEPDDVKILAESLARLRGKDGKPPGHFLATFTPTEGFRDTYLTFVPGGVFPADGTHPDDPSKFTQRIGWKDSPHLDEGWKASCLANWKISDPNNLEARTEGYAAMGSGRVYPIDEDFVIVPKMMIPSYWPKAYGLDPGHANTACIWLTQDPNTGVLYVYDEYKNGRVNYVIHVDAIRARGDWIQGAIDFHEAVKPRDTGESVLDYFESKGLNVVPSIGNSDALIIRIRSMLDSGTLKIMNNCQGLVSEIRTYRFDPNDPNKIAKNQEDHRLDALRYGISRFEEIKKSSAEIEEEIHAERNKGKDDYGDDNRNEITGY